MSHPSRTFRSRKDVTCSLETTLQRPSPHTGASPQGHPVPWCLRIEIPTQAAVTNMVTSDSAGKTTKYVGMVFHFHLRPFSPQPAHLWTDVTAGWSHRHAGLGPRPSATPRSSQAITSPPCPGPGVQEGPTQSHHTCVPVLGGWWPAGVGHCGGRAPRSLWPRPSGPDAPQTRAPEAHRTPHPLARSWVCSWVGDLVPTSAQEGPGCRRTWAPSVSGRVWVGRVVLGS